MSLPVPAVALPGPDPLLGTRLAGRYDIVARIGTGGMATVYSARHALIGREVAVKVLRGRHATDPGAGERLLREARFVGSLGHPNIVEALDVGVAPDGAPFIVLEILKGRSLADEILRLGILPVDRAAGIARQVTSAMIAAHDNGIVHRDIKPDNIFLVESDALDLVKVLDFGIARELASPDRRVTGDGHMVGTPDYMAPEQIMVGAQTDLRADVYALGVVLYQMVAGRTPFANTPPADLVRRIAQENPPPLVSLRPDLEPGFLAVVDRALQRAPEARFQSMGEFSLALRAFAITGEYQAARARSITPAVTARRITADGLALTPSRPVTAESVPPAPAAQWAIEGATAPTATFRPHPTTSQNLTSWGGAAQAPAQPAPAPHSSRTGLVVATTVAALALVLCAYLLLRMQAPPAPGPAPAVAQDVLITISSRTPLAETTLRGSRLPLPFSGRFRPSSEPEMLETTAPGFAPRRMWLKLERDLTLSIDLEPAAPAPPAPVEAPPEPAAPAPVVAPPVPTVAAKPSVPSTASSASPRPRTSPPLEPKPSPVAAPAPVMPAPAPTPLPEPVVVAAPVVAPPPPPAPAPAPVAPPAPAPVVAKPLPPAQISADALQRASATHRSAIEECIAEDPSVSGTLQLKLTARADGVISGVEPLKGGSAIVRKCIVTAVRTWKLPPADRESIGTLSIDLE